MPRKVRDMLKIIKKDGWYLENQVGSHRQFKHPSKPGRVTISGHRESADVPLQIEKSILKQAGLL
jgi:predicted RNA binding protein YcfA (HicA-like mRNA interferase family)